MILKWRMYAAGLPADTARITYPARARVCPRREWFTAKVAKGAKIRKEGRGSSRPTFFALFASFAVKT
jgi:hypothetical protein